MGKSQKRSVKKVLEKAKEREQKRLIAKYQPKIDPVVELTKPRLVALLFCMFQSKDVENRNNLLGCFGRVFADPATKQTGQFILFLRTCETREKGLVVSVLDPSNKAIAAIVIDKPNEMPTDRPMHLEFFAPINFTATVEGQYWFDVSYKGKSIGGEALAVEFSKPETKK